jgi:uncharacterized protein YgiM (DUF1202 family)
MSLLLKQRIALILLMAVTGLLTFNSTKLNEDSFEDASSIIYAIKTDIGNMREGPGKIFKVTEQLKRGAVFSAKKVENGWVKGDYNFIGGWVHRSILGKYLYLEYYDDKIMDESVFELEWGN